VELFDYLSIAALIDNAIFCVHGGLSPSIQTVDQIRVLDRFKELPAEGALSDLMWSDPSADHEGFRASQRGAGYSFGEDVVRNFLRANSVTHIVRAHQLCTDGYQVLFKDALSTVWSAPNYCYRCGNVAAIMEVAEDHKRRYNTFTAAPDSDRLTPENDSTREAPDYFL
jgi:serine/threonine-protein phosphatase PPG1